MAKKKPQLIKCKICKKTIPKKSNKSWKVYLQKKCCSIQCFGKYQRKKYKLKCANCKKVIYRTPSGKKLINYCSLKCFRLANTFSFRCEKCNKKVRRPISSLLDYSSHTRSSFSHNFCSRRCANTRNLKN